MHTPRLLPLGQQLFSLALAALVTAGVLLSLGAQADQQHAGALLAQAGSQQQACAAAELSPRS